MARPLAWHAVDADDRYPGRFTAYVTAHTIAGITYRARITPGSADTYAAPGWHAAIDGDAPAGQWSLTGRDLSPLMAEVERDMADDAFAAHTMV